MTQSANEIKAVGTKATIFGVIAIILGFLCMFTPLLTGIAVAFLVGTLVLIGGIVRVVWAFQAESFGQGLLKFAIGALTLLGGIVLVSDPLLATGFLTVLLSAYLFADGVCEIAAALQFRSESGWGWMLFGGIVSILLGLMIWSQFPLSGAWAIGILLGIKLFLVGMIMLTAGSAVRAEVS